MTYRVIYRDPMSDGQPHQTHTGEIRWADGVVELYDCEDGMAAVKRDPARIIPAEALIKADRVGDNEA
jgi:hypothetical protein